jgi:putative DNA primase/helicase
VLPSPKLPLEVARVVVEDSYRADHGRLTLRRWRGAFWAWHRSRWVELEDSAVRSALYTVVGDAVFLDDKNNEKPWAPNRYKIADLVDALAAITHLAEATATPSWLDAPETSTTLTGVSAVEIVACDNGLLHVPTRTLHDHTASFFNEVAVPFDYSPNAAIPTRWFDFLAQLWPDDPDAIAALQEWFGYVISGRTDLHKVLLLIGPTRSGKGTIARVLKALVGDGNAAGPTLASLGTNFGLSPLIGKPLAIVADARLAGGAHQIVERLLSISGEDMLTIDRKYREPWSGTLPTRFTIISNELPRFGDASGAIANRMIVLTMRWSWLGREDPQLTRVLLNELPGILGWALDGLDRLNLNGRFTEPASSTDAALSLADLASPVSAFTRDCCVIGPEYEVLITDLFTMWKRWCDDNGRDRPGTVQTFGRDLRAVVPGLSTVRPRDGSNRERHYQGVGLVSRTHNGNDRGPSWTTSMNGTPGPQSTSAAAQESPRSQAPVHDGPQSEQLSVLVQNDDNPPPLTDDDIARLEAEIWS